MKKLYDRCVELARHKFSKPLLGFVAFIESFFFPVPPDLMIVPMVVAKREDYLKVYDEEKSKISKQRFKG